MVYNIKRNASIIDLQPNLSAIMVRMQTNSLIPVNLRTRNPTTNRLSDLRELVFEVTLRTRKFTTNRLLNRRQFILDVLHQSHPTISKHEVREKLATIYKTDEKRIVIICLRRHFGGGRSTGFALIYDDEQSQRKFEPKYRLIQSGIIERSKEWRYNTDWRKTRKNCRKKLRGTKKATMPRFRKQ